MENNIETRLAAQEEKLEAIYTSVKKTERYLKVTMWVTIIVFVLPLVAAFFIVPIAINSYLAAFDGLL